METNNRKLSKVALIVFAVISLPVIILSFYNIPSADDYTFSQMVKGYVSENGYHIWGIIKCGIQNSIDHYFNWQGRYSESFFASFMPDIFGYYWVWAIFLYFFFFGGVVFLFCTIIQHFVGKEHMGTGVCIGLLVGTSIAQNVPFPVEAFYWFDGSVAYMFHHSIYIWMCGLAVKYFFAETRKASVKYLILLCILTILVAGGNNVTSFISIMTYCVFGGIAILIRKKAGILLPFTLSICGFMVSYLSPGTAIRGGDSSNWSPVFITIKNCFVWTGKQYLFKWITPGLIVMLIFLTPLLLNLLMKMIEKYSFKFPFPLLLLIGDVCFLAAMSCPSFYVLGEPGPGRLRNIIFVNYIIIVVLTYSYLLGWLLIKDKNRQMMKIMQLYQRVPQKFNIIAAVITFVFLCTGDFQQYGISMEAVKELVSGEAAQYYEEGMERKEKYMDPSLLEVEVEPYSIKPYLLFFDDITDDPENWKNVALRMFYGKKSVKLSRYDPDVDYD